MDCKAKGKFVADITPDTALTKKCPEAWDESTGHMIAGTHLHSLSGGC